MESKKPISFAAAAAAAAAAKPAPTPASGTSTPSAGSAPSASAPAPAPAPSAAGAAGKNGSNGAAAQSSPALGSQSPATSSAIATHDKAISSGGIDWVLGKHVKVVTQSDEVFEGQVYAYDVLMNCVSVTPAVTPSAYYSPSANNNGSNNGTVRPRYDFRILKINYIKDVTPIIPSSSPEQLGVASSPSIPTKSNNGSVVTSPNPESVDSNITNNIYSTVVPALGYIQLDKIQQREQQAIREAQVAAARIGVGVSSSAQDIFDALSKTLPCRWAKDSIVVMDEVIIAPPYEPENCKANASASYTLARVKKVVS
ncbi:hypothetical protein BG006_005496 [Podila minutissima]|uniref:AD domain-containing protein n=1 Tax=Podila minutissima TaxID=64525 RepID=A0A9P5SSC3_9FUNG|nr:hypothetical protein BG006_005496 [Podila minutissima]